MKIQKIFVLILAISLALSVTVRAQPSENNTVCAVYITGIGCPHCAETDPVIFTEKVNEYNLIVIEYEIYQNQGNAQMIVHYNQEYESGHS